jgi:hypothetical protein
MAMRVTNDVRKLLAWLEGAPVPEAQIVAAGFNHTLAISEAQFSGFWAASDQFPVRVSGRQFSISEVTRETQFEAY